MAEITHEELLERVALLRKFKSVLEQQRNKFKEYLSVLEKQQNSIESENPETILAHTELEQQVVKNISNLQKVIVPMSKMYKSLGVSQNQMPEIEHIQNLLADEDVAFEDGTWTEGGITSLGLLYQQMQLAQQKSKEYAEAYAAKTGVSFEIPIKTEEKSNYYLKLNLFD